MNDPLLRIRDLHFAHGSTAVLNGVNLDLERGEVLIVVGPSGCGKSTFLRAIAGLEKPSSGSITLDGTVLYDTRTYVPAEKRSVGMVFQGLALFPHLTVSGNVGFGLHKSRAQERTQRVKDELEAVGLQNLGDRYPHQLSGGQQQRVAIARSLIIRPKVLLMDEPFSDLDATTRRTVRTEVLRILRAHGTACIIVSHDPEDAAHLGDRTVSMVPGADLALQPN